MASQKAGQKRKVVEIPRPHDGSKDGEDFPEDGLNGALEDDGESEEDVSEDSDGSEDDGLEEDGEDDFDLDSDEIPSSDEEEDVRQQIRDLKTDKQPRTPPEKL